MEKTSLKKIFLVICIIMTLLAPSICADIVYAMDEDVQDEVQEDVEKSESTQPQENDSATDEEVDSQKEEGTSSDAENQDAEDEQETTEGENLPEATSSEELDVDAEETDIDQNEVQAMGINTIAAPQQQFYTNGQGEIVVRAIDGALQTAINNADDDATLVLEGDRYTNGNQPIVINKSLTIKSSRKSVIIEEVQIKAEEKINVNLEGLILGLIRAKEEHDCLDIQSSVDLTIKNVRLMDIGGGSIEGEKKPSIINIANEANNSEIKILEGSEIFGCYDGIRVKSSSTTINIKDSKVLTEIALKMENGSGNNINIEDSEINTGSSITSEYEGISIDNQNNLTININNSQIIGTGIGGSKYEDTKLFSIDDASSNVELSIKGNSKIELQRASAKNCIFNFGDTFDNTNKVSIDSTVELPKKVSERYNTSDKYFIVGIYDENGDLEVKSYNKNDTLTLNDNPTKVGYRFDKWMYKIGDDETGKEFNKPYTVTANMDVFPQFIETVNVQIGDNSGDTYTIDKGQKLNDLDNSKKEEAKGKVEALKNEIDEDEGKTFREFIDSATGEILKDVDAVMEHTISQDTKILAVYNYVLTVGGETFILPNESKTLGELMELGEYSRLKEIVENLSQKVAGKTFKEFQNQDGEPVSEGTTIDKDTVLTPKYTVNLTVKAENETTYTIDENTTLADLKNSKPEAKTLLEKLSGKQETKKKFEHFEALDGTVIDETTPIKEHTTITPKYTVTVTIKKNSKDEVGKTFTLYEGQTLADLTEVEKEQMREYVETDKKEFVGFKDFNESTKITEDIELTPIYNVTITIKTQDGDRVFVIRDGNKLSDIGNQTMYQATMEKANRTFSRFVYTDNGAEQTFDMNSAINQDITLTPKFNVTVTINGIEYKLEEGKTLGDLTPEGKAALDALKSVKGKTFVEYTDKDGNKIELDNPVNDNIIVTAKYNVTVTVGENTYTLDEGQKLANLPQNAQDAIKALENVEGKNFEKYEYFDEDGKLVEFKPTDEIHYNITIKAKYTVTITVGGNTYTLDEGQSLENLNAEGQAALEALKSVTNKKFVEFTDENGNPINVEDELHKNTTIKAKYNVIVTIGNETFELEEGQNLGNIKQEDQAKFEATKTKGNQKFLRFVDKNGETFNESTPINENTTLTPKFEITLKIGGSEYKLEEGQTLNDLTPQAKQALETLKDAEPGKNFAGYEANGQPIEMNTPLNENAEITAKFGVRVKIGDQEFDIEENQTLNDLSAEGKAALDALRNAKGKQFVEFVDSEGNSVDPNEQLTTNITVTAKYNVTVTVGGNTYTLAEGQTLADLPQDAIDAIEALQDVENKTFIKYEYVDEDGNVVELQSTDEIHFNITIKAKYTVKVEISKEDGTTESFVLTEGQTLNDLSNEDKAKLQAIKDNHAEGWRFAKFINAETGEEIGENTPITKDTVIKPVYEKIPAEEAETTQNEDNNGIVNPKTSDNILNFVALGLIGLACIVISIIAYRRKNK